MRTIGQILDLIQSRKEEVRKILVLKNGVFFEKPGSGDLFEVWSSDGDGNFRRKA